MICENKLQIKGAGKIVLPLTNALYIIHKMVRSGGGVEYLMSTIKIFFGRYLKEKSREKYSASYSFS